MVERVSPIVYRKIDVSAFTKKGFEKETENQYLFYDEVSKKLVQISDGGIKIFNKSATNLKKDIRLQLNKESIYKIAVDKKLNYMLIFIEKNEERSLLIVNIQKEIVIQMLRGDLNNLLGMFFMFNTQTLSINERQNTYFTLVYKDRIHYFTIIKSDNDSFLDTVDLIDEVKYVVEIKKYIYNAKYMILCIQKEKDEEYFDFYNLNNVKYFSQSFVFFKDSGKEKPSGFFSFLFGSKKKLNEEEENPNEPIIAKKENYSQNHFFLEAIYKKLYFVYLNYEEGFIQFYHIKTLQEIKKIYEIQFENKNETTLQFLDNLILIHNIDKMETTVLDLKSQSEDKVLFPAFPISSFDIIKHNKGLTDKMIDVKILPNPNQNSDDLLTVNLTYNYIATVSMLTLTNRTFYMKKISVRGGVIEEKSEDKKISNTLYDVYFDPMIYYDNCPEKGEALFNLAKRKNGKDVIIHGLYELLRSGKNTKLIKEVFDCIVKEIVKNRLMHNINTGGIILTKERENKGQLLLRQLESYRDAHELAIPFRDIFLKKKDLIIQSDIYFRLFSAFKFDNEIPPEYIVLNMIKFGEACNEKKIKLTVSYYNVMIMFLKKVKRMSKISSFFQFHSINDSVEMANFLIYHIGLSETRFEDRQMKSSCFQFGIDILIRLGKFSLVVDVLLRVGGVPQAITVIKKYRLSSRDIDPETQKALREAVKNYDKYLIFGAIEEWKNVLMINK